MITDECSKSPVMLGYSDSHFCPLIPVPGDKPRRFPLVDKDGELLPVHFKNDPATSPQTSISLIQKYLGESFATADRMPCVNLESYEPQSPISPSDVSDGQNATQNPSKYNYK